MIARSGFAGVLLIAASLGVHALPSFDAVRAGWRSSEAVLADRHGEPIQTLRMEPRVRRLEWVRLADVSPALRLALLYSEDRRFYEHSGVDWRAVAAAAWGNLWHTRTRGASTLTMQLAGLIDEDARRPRGGPRSIGTKLAQMAIARELETHWRKDQILEAYLNLVAYRGELVGVAAMSAALFDKHPSGLDAAEAALAAALLRSPNAPARQVATRACGVLREQGLGAYCGGLESLAQASLGRRSATLYEAIEPLAPHLARQLLAHPGQTLRSTLDASTQRYARDVLRRHLASLAGRNVEDGAVIVLDNASGDVLAWVGSSGARLSHAHEVDAVRAPRQAGSTLKPFLYGLALEEHRMTAASIVEDLPLRLDAGNALFIPRNYDRTFKGPVSVRTALASSLNVPAVRTAMLVSPERLRGRLRAFGLTTLSESADWYGYSLALGAAEVTLADLANAYRALANGGRWTALRMRMDAPRAKPRQVMDAAAAFVVADILSDRNARARTFGLDNSMATRFWSAVKTGTSKDMRDNWAIGFSQRYTVGVWVGNASGAPMHDVSGMHGAAPVWLDVLSALHAHVRSRPPAPPTGLVRAAVAFEGGIEPVRHEWFLAGTERARSAPVPPAEAQPGIASPVDGVIIALDPDMPAAVQRLPWRADGVGTAARWRLDGRVLAHGVRHDWMPWPGRHVLELVENGAVRDTVRFEVRGAYVSADSTR